jgi:hypothetical protein
MEACKQACVDAEAVAVVVAAHNTAQLHCTAQYGLID